MQFKVPDAGDKFVVDASVKIECITKVKRSTLSKYYRSGYTIKHVSIEFNKGDSVVFCNVDNPFNIILIRQDKTVEKIGLYLRDLDKLSITLSQKKFETNIVTIKHALAGTAVEVHKKKLLARQVRAIKTTFFSALQNSCDENMFLRASCYDMLHVINEKYKTFVTYNPQNIKHIEKFEDLFKQYFWYAYTKIKDDGTFKATFTYNRVKDCKWLCEGTVDNSIDVKITNMLPMPPQKNKNV